MLKISGKIKKSNINSKKTGVWFILTEVTVDNEKFDNNLFCNYMTERKKYKSDEIIQLRTPNLRDNEQITITAKSIQEQEYNDSKSFSCFVDSIQSEVTFVEDIIINDEKYAFTEVNNDDDLADKLPF